MWPPETPYLTVDAVVIDERGVLLIRRRNPPYGWALPGGFVERGESVESAVRREAREETGLEIEDLRLIGVYSDPDRDPRFPTASVVYLCRAKGDPRSADDAAEVRFFSHKSLPDEIAFDHRRIIDDAFRLRLEM
ncbi:MAG: NUDIX hydrolase [Calditrichaeota bacterium]|nr:NUDIX hydrolase [Calditrichota bacterium]